MTADGYKNQESSQSQSANFDKKTNSLQATNANTNVKETITNTGHRREQSSGSSATNQNQHGSSNSQAQTNTVEFNEKGMKGTGQQSSAQSQQINKDGSAALANAHSATNVIKTDDGREITQQESGASSSHQGAGGNSASASNCGSTGTGNNQGYGGSYSYSSSSSSSSSFGGGPGQTQSSSGCKSGSVSGPGFVPAQMQIFPNPFLFGPYGR